MLLTFGPEATVGSMMQPQMLGQQDCGQRIFTAYVEAGQMSALARRLGYFTPNSPFPVLKSSGFRLFYSLTAMCEPCEYIIKGDNE